MLRFERVLLFTSPVLLGKNRMPYNPPASLGYVAEALKSHSIQYEIIDTYFGYNYDYISKKIHRFKPDLFGISMFTHQFRTGYDLLKKLRGDFSDIGIVAGGPHISTLRKKVLEECGEIDFGIVLEGEDAIIELCEGKQLSSIPGLIYRDNLGIQYTGDRAFVDDLDSIAFPRYGSFELSKYVEKRIPIISSRGCPYQCIYCPVKVTIGRKYRIRSPKNVLEEMVFWYDRGYRLFSFLDDNFTLNNKRVYELCDMIQSSGMKGLNMSCPNGVRADKVSKDLLRRMRDVGFRELAFGVEVGNDRMLKAIKKGVRMSRIEQSIQDACDLGFRTILFFIIGSPGESWADFEDALALAEKYPVFSARFYQLIPFPSTELYGYLEERKYFLVPPEEYLNERSGIVNEPVFATPQLSKEERIRAFILGEKLQKRIFRNYFRKKLMRLGLAGQFISRILTMDFFLNLYWYHPFFRKTFGRVKNYF